MTFIENNCFLLSLAIYNILFPLISRIYIHKRKITYIYSEVFFALFIISNYSGYRSYVIQDLFLAPIKNVGHEIYT